MKMYLIFDVGTTSVKTALYDMKGALKYKIIKDYALNSPIVGWYEVEPEVYWNSVIGGFKEILNKSGISPKEIKTISGCSQGETVIFLDAGASFPENDTYARGVFYGLTLKHGKAHFVRAIMESIGYMLRKILIYVKQFGVQINEIHSMGGAARSELWLQIKSDICGYPIVKMKEEETAALGAAILASVKAGDYSNVNEAVKVMVKTGKRYLPNEENKELYEKYYVLYNELYGSLKPLFRKY